MSNSKKLPIIEIGDKSKFEINFDGNVCAKFEMNDSTLSVTAAMNGYGNSIPLEAIHVSEVIKPSKARVYSEQDLKKAYEQGLEDGYHFDGSRSDWEAEGLSSHLSDEYVKSLNTEGK